MPGTTVTPHQNAKTNAKKKKKIKYERICVHTRETKIPCILRTHGQTWYRCATKKEKKKEKKNVDTYSK